MSFLGKIRDALALPAVAAGSYPTLVSPYAEPHSLHEFIPPHRGIPETVSRKSAMSVAALNKARRIICTSVAKCPLVLEGPGAAPAWLTRTNGPVSPYHRMLWTVDDLLFYGWCLWAIERDSSGAILAADRVPWGSWCFNQNGEVEYQGEVVSNDSVILIPGSDEGILTFSTAISMAANLEKAANRAAKNPTPHTVLEQVAGEKITKAEAQQIVSDWAEARRNPDGAISFTNSSIKARFEGAYDANLLTEGRQYAAIELARLTGIPAILLDAGGADSTIRYSNVDARNIELVDYCLDSFMAPIAARLGMDDVVAPGQRFSFDISGLTAAPTHATRVPDDQPSTQGLELAEVRKISSNG